MKHKTVQIHKNKTLNKQIIYQEININKYKYINKYTYINKYINK